MSEKGCQNSIRVGKMPANRDCILGGGQKWLESQTIHNRSEQLIKLCVWNFFLVLAYVGCYGFYKVGKCM